MDWMELADGLPPEQIVQALDDNRDGEADAEVWERVRSGAEARIGDCFGGPPPAKFAQACAYARKVFLLEVLYVRRGFAGSANPYSAKATDAERRLRALAGGAESVDAGAAGPDWAETQHLAGTPTKGFLA